MVDAQDVAKSMQKTFSRGFTAVATAASAASENVSKKLEKNVEKLTEQIRTLAQEDEEVFESYVGTVRCVYSTSDDDDDSDTANLLQFDVSTPLAEADITKNFPVPGSYHFRVRERDPEFGYVWVDFSNPARCISATTSGKVEIQALRIRARAAPQHLNGAARVGPAAAAAPAAAPAARRGSPPPAAGMPNLMEPGEKPELQRRFTTPPGDPTAPQVPLPSREVLAANRIAEVERRKQESLDAHRKRQKDEEDGKAAKVVLQQSLAKKFDEWSLMPDGKFKDVRTLLCSIPDVIWADSGYVAPKIGDVMLNANATKKEYRKAILMCHPDKQKDAPPEQVYRADRIFNALSESWKNFDS